MPEHDSSKQTRVLAIADSDSYVKWGAALLSRAPAEWDRRLLVLASPVLPSADQLSAALASAGRSIGRPAVVDLNALFVRVQKMQPDVVLLSLRGQLVKVVVRAVLGASTKRPVFVSGLPGISVPATKMAIAHRAQADLFVLHSKREVREFQALAEKMEIEQVFGLARLPFLTAPAGSGADAGRARRDLTGDIVFAAQAKVPIDKHNRLELLGWLAETARQHPERRVVVKVRATHGEQQTHAETHDYAELMSELRPAAPANLVVEGGAMSAHLAGASGLVTVSSTAAIEAVALGRPVLALEDFGVSRSLINTVFEGSGLLGCSDDLIAGRFMQPEQHWLDDNYFHAPGSDDWVQKVHALLEIRAAGDFAAKTLKRGNAGGKLRRAWDRKRALGRFDRSWSGMGALAFGMPFLVTLRAYRSARARVRRALRMRAITEEH
ncbi:MAG: hypothetical protein JWN80_2629 [Microbacteriaceae bacterium]|jgi:hypothetical protein|nr:hypothetical protein [Microbacteriaceae bacterium]